MRVGVVGAGTAGSAAAAFLGRAGHEVTVLERVPDPGPVGAGIVLQPTGLGVLERLGVRDQVVARGARLDALRCVTTRRRTVVHLVYERLGASLFGLGTHRGLLFEALSSAMKSASVTVRCGVDLVSVDHEGALPVLVARDGARHGPFELVVIADGARSSLRQALGSVRRDAPYPWGALWFVADDPDGAHERELFQVVEGTGRFLGLLPTGLGPGDGTGSKVSLFWSVRCDAVDALRTAGLGAFKREVLRCEPRAEAVLAQIDDIDQLLVAQYRDVVLSRYHAGRLVCIGDAAHSMSPQLGQGANLALYDAMVLAECLGEGGDVPEALARYTARRRLHLAFYQRMSRWLTPFFQSDARWLGPLRDIGMSLACRLPPIRTQMLRTMCGAKRGLLRRSLALSAPADPR